MNSYISKSPVHVYPSFHALKPHYKRIDFRLPLFIFFANEFSPKLIFPKSIHLSIVAARWPFHKGWILPSHHWGAVSPIYLCSSRLFLRFFNSTAFLALSHWRLCVVVPRLAFPSHKRPTEYTARTHTHKQSNQMNVRDWAVIFLHRRRRCDCWSQEQWREV